MSTTLTITQRWLSAQETADYLGIKIKTLYNLNSAGAGPARFRAGKSVRYREEDVLTYAETLRVAG